MKISVNWLEEYVRTDRTAEELSDILTMAGLEVEEILRQGPTFDGVVVGHILAVQGHPNADRLSVCIVDLGRGEPERIVCGAPNVAEGQFVPVATVGTTLHLPDPTEPGRRIPLTISTTKIRSKLTTT